MSKPRRFSPLAIPRLTTFLVLGLGLFLLAFGSGAFVTIETGNVGVDRTLGKINMVERPAGLSFKLPFITSVTEFSAKDFTPGGPPRRPSRLRWSPMIPRRRTPPQG